MKFLFALFATSVATAAAQDPLTPAVDATDLASRWDMADEPQIFYDKGLNTIQRMYECIFLGEKLSLLISD